MHVHDPLDPDTAAYRLSRRRVLAWAGTAGLALVAATCGGGSSGASGAATRKSSGAAGGSSGDTTTSTAGTTATTAAGTTSAWCALAPEMTEGPYYLTGEPERRDVTEGKAGVPLRLTLTVVDATRCAVIPGAIAEIWHADAQGNYSGFGAGASSYTFLRGSQVADANGKVTFDTIYPGWYQGRATHIHLKVRPSTNATTVHTGQLFFDEAVTDAVNATSAYGGRSGRRTLNSQDNIYANGGAQSTLALAKDGDAYTGTITVGLQGAQTT